MAPRWLAWWSGLVNYDWSFGVAFEIPDADWMNRCRSNLENWVRSDDLYFVRKCQPKFIFGKISNLFMNFYNWMHALKVFKVFQFKNDNPNQKKIFPVKPSFKHASFMSITPITIFLYSFKHCWNEWCVKFIIPGIPPDLEDINRPQNQFSSTTTDVDGGGYVKHGKIFENLRTLFAIFCE